MGIFKFTRKKEDVIKSYNIETVDGAEVWIVSWFGRTGQFSTDRNKVAKAFLSEQDALDFKKSLQDAQKLLHYTEDLNIEIIKQQ